MPIDTRLDGNPGQIFSAAGWLNGRLAFEVQASAETLHSVGSEAAESWKGSAGAAFTGRMGRAGALAGTLHGEITSTARAFDDYGNRLASAQARMAAAREAAAAGGLPVFGTTISEPVNPSAPDYPRQVAAYQVAAGEVAGARAEMAAAVAALRARQAAARGVPVIQASDVAQALKAGVSVGAAGGGLAGGIAGGTGVGLGPAVAGVAAGLAGSGAGAGLGAAGGGIAAGLGNAAGGPGGAVGAVAGGVAAGLGVSANAEITPNGESSGGAIKPNDQVQGEASAANRDDEAAKTTPNKPAESGSATQPTPNKPAAGDSSAPPTPSKPAESAPAPDANGQIVEKPSPEESRSSISAA
jgi:hypothetical protein